MSSSAFSVAPPGLRPRTPLGEFTTLPQTPQSAGEGDTPSPKNPPLMAPLAPRFSCLRLYILRVVLESPWKVLEFDFDKWARTPLSLLLSYILITTCIVNLSMSRIITCLCFSVFNLLHIVANMYRKYSLFIGFCVKFCCVILETVGVLWRCHCFSCCVFVLADKRKADSNDITEHPHDDKPRPYKCTVCDKRFTTKRALDIHKPKHTAKHSHSCTQCGKSYLSQDCLKVHMNVHSSKYKCTECRKCLSSSRDLTVHSRIHSGEKPFKCTVCDKRFTRSDQLVIHSKTHSGQKPYRCHECHKTFSVSTSLNTHMRIHTGDKPYKCSLCDKSFSRSSHLNTHKRHVHSNRRPYDCRYCGMLFKSSHHLKHHVYTHTGAKPYSCRHCSECFTFHNQLKTHVEVTRWRYLVHVSHLWEEIRLQR